MLTTFEVVLAVLVELRGGDVESQGNIVAEGVTSLLDCLDNEIQSGTGGLDGWRKTAFIAQTGGQTLVLDDLLQSVVDLGANAQRLSEESERRSGRS